MSTDKTPPNINQNDKLAYICSCGAGVFLWVVIVLFEHKLEAWDSSWYWMVSYPLSILFCLFLGYLFPQRAWRWGFSLMLSQAVVLVLTAGSLTMLPLGILVFAVLSLPLIGAGKIGAWWAFKQKKA